MKILLTGKNGQLGFELWRSLAPLAEICAVDVSECDLADEKAVRQLIRESKPDLIVNPAAYTAVDRAESESDLAWKINAEAPRIIGEEAQRIGAWVIHYSTDYVFDGTKSGAYLEQDPTSPLNVYGKSKHEGEKSLGAMLERHLILRTSWVVGSHGANFAKTVLRLAKERETLSIVSDQHGAPTSAALLADITAQIVGRARREGLQSLPFGLYHVTSSGETSWYGYAKFVVEHALASGVGLKATLDSIKPIATADYPLPARRPVNSRLDTELFRRTFELELPDWREGVSHVLEQVLSS